MGGYKESDDTGDSVAVIVTGTRRVSAGTCGQG